MFSHRQFDVEVSRHFRPERLRWRLPAEVHGEEWNQSYVDLGGFSWPEARRVFQLESEVLRRIEESVEPQGELISMDDELYEEPDEHLHGLDIGVASAVAALSATGCPPIASCNAGAFGDSHREHYPLVAFFAFHDALPAIQSAAEKADAGLENGHDGMLVVYANDIRKMMQFAARLLNASA
jgi:hypothetical protein